MKDDTISRAAAVALVEEVESKRLRGEIDLTYAPMIKGIKALPSAQLAQDLLNGCTDTISRAAVVDALNRIEISRNASWYEFYQKAITAVGTLPPAQPGWISVTERLPDVKQRVLVQQKDGFMMVRKCIDGGHLAWFYSDIVAWMPLPKPWGGEKP